MFRSGSKPVFVSGGVEKKCNGCIRRRRRRCHSLEIKDVACLMLVEGKDMLAIHRGRYGNGQSWHTLGRSKITTRTINPPVQADDDARSWKGSLYHHACFIISLHMTVASYLASCYYPLRRRLRYSNHLLLLLLLSLKESSVVDS